jgi:hypothetical protein
MTYLYGKNRVLDQNGRTSGTEKRFDHPQHLVDPQHIEGVMKIRKIPLGQLIKA